MANMTVITLRTTRLNIRHYRHTISFQRRIDNKFTRRKPRRVSSFIHHFRINNGTVRITITMTFFFTTNHTRFNGNLRVTRSSTRRLLQQRQLHRRLLFRHNSITNRSLHRQHRAIRTTLLRRHMFRTVRASGPQVLLTFLRVVNTHVSHIVRFHGTLHHQNSPLVHHTNQRMRHLHLTRITHDGHLFRHNRNFGRHTTLTTRMRTGFQRQTSGHSRQQAYLNYNVKHNNQHRIRNTTQITRRATDSHMVTKSGVNISRLTRTKHGILTFFSRRRTIRSFPFGDTVQTVSSTGAHTPNQSHRHIQLTIIKVGIRRRFIVISLTLNHNRFQNMMRRTANNSRRSRQANRHPTRYTKEQDRKEDEH